MKNLRNARPTTRRLFLEGLERRELLAGNVLVDVTRGFLTVTGDAAANQLTIYQQIDGTFTITGLDDEVITGPTENILARNVLVNLGAGDDLVEIGQPRQDGREPLLPASVLGSTTINGGDGTDAILVSIVGRQAVTLALPALSLTIDTGVPGVGAEPQGVLVTNTAAAAVTVRTGAGNDLINLPNVTAVSLTVESGPSNANLTTDFDTVSAAGLTAARASFNLGLNNSDNFLVIVGGLFGTLQVTGGNAEDQVILANVHAGLSLSVSTYGGADAVTLEDVPTGLTQTDYQNVADLVLVAFGASLNSLPFNLSALISVLPNFPGMLTVSTGDGADVVTASNLHSTFAIYIYLDAGDDQLVAGDVESDFFAWFFGGAGTDGRLLTNVDALSELDLQFESILEPDQGPVT